MSGTQYPPNRARLNSLVGPHNAISVVWGRRRLLAWYDANKRDLPWRADREPYHVWVSEIMLQQTRVAAVVEYYQRFLLRFPDVHSLARARGSSVLAVWSGLGYYRRARSLHAAAQIISRQRKGCFPETAREWAELPGIGAYTAAAIASIAFDEPCAVVDGNVERVLRRTSGDAKLSGKALWQLAQRLISPGRPGDFNQAMMELGATVCLPEQPRCGDCPLVRWCAAQGTMERPTAAARKRKLVAYMLDRRDGAVYLVKRGPESLMPGMWELPEANAKSVNGDAAFTLRHSITDTDYTVKVLPGKCAEVANGRWVSPNGLSRLPLTGLARKILRKIEVI
jgi:A/G-specific adenine glycosylase